MGKQSGSIIMVISSEISEKSWNKSTLYPTSLLIEIYGNKHGNGMSIYKRYIYTSIFIIAQLIAKILNQPRYPSTNLVKETIKVLLSYEK